MGLNFNLERKVALSEESEFANLYKWSLHELDETGKKVGRDQIPWSWSLYFTATEISFQEALSLEIEPAERIEPADGTTKGDRRHIRAKLVPSGYGNLSQGQHYSFFGTGRQIERFELLIYPLDEVRDTEQCFAWGSPSYTTEIDLSDEITDDLIDFYIFVTAERFERYAELIRRSAVSSLAMQAWGVSGFYSEWSPMISTDRIKVLSNLKDQRVALPDGGLIDPPKLGEVCQCELTISTKRELSKPKYLVELEDGSVSSTQPTLTAEDESVSLQRDIRKLSTQIARWLKLATYAGWTIAALLLLLLLRR